MSVSIDVQQLRAAVLAEWAAWQPNAGGPETGPCGAIAVALFRLGFGKVARLYAISAEPCDGCVPPYGEDWDEGENTIWFPHYAVMTPSGSILDVALPPDFEVAGYEDIYVCERNLPFEDEQDLWDENDFIYWERALQAALNSVTERAA